MEKARDRTSRRDARCDVVRLRVKCVVDVLHNEDGQTTVEAAFAVPILLLLVLMLVQPGIILYDRMVMQSAAAEGCRILACAEGDGVDACTNFVKRRLGAVPQQDCFHVHSTGCSWKVECAGGASAQSACVTISTEVDPLPLLDMGATLLGLVNERGNLEVKVSVETKTRALWAQESLGGGSVNDKVGAWHDES